MRAYLLLIAFLVCLGDPIQVSAQKFFHIGHGKYPLGATGYPNSQFLVHDPNQFGLSLNDEERWLLEKAVFERFTVKPRPTEKFPEASIRHLNENPWTGPQGREIEESFQSRIAEIVGKDRYQALRIVANQKFIRESGSLQMFIQLPAIEHELGIDEAFWSENQKKIDRIGADFKSAILKSLEIELETIMESLDAENRGFLEAMLKTEPQRSSKNSFFNRFLFKEKSTRYSVRSVRGEFSFVEYDGNECEMLLLKLISFPVVLSTLGLTESQHKSIVQESAAFGLRFREASKADRLFEIRESNEEIEAILTVEQYAKIQADGFRLMYCFSENKIDFFKDRFVRKHLELSDGMVSRLRETCKAAEKTRLLSIKESMDSMNQAFLKLLTPDQKAVLNRLLYN